MSSQVHPSEWTFGVEIELVVHLRRDHILPDGSNDFCAYWLLQKVREQLVLSDIPTNPYPEPFADLPLNDYTAWTVEVDSSVKSSIPNPPKALFTKGIELVSRKLPFEYAAIQEIRRALEAVRSIGEIYVNHSCALHVHIGLPDDSPIPLKVADNLLRVAISQEKLIEQMQDPEYLNSKPYQIRAPPFSSNPAMHRPSILDTCQLIHLARSAKELHARVKPAGGNFERRTAYNVLGVAYPNHIEDGKRVKPTIEFRRLAASIDAEEIKWQVHFIYCLLQFCHADDKEVMDLFAEMAHKDEAKLSCIDRGLWTLQDLLETLGANKDCVEFFSGRNFAKERAYQQEPTAIFS